MMIYRNIILCFLFICCFSCKQDDIKKEKFKQIITLTSSDGIIKEYTVISAYKGRPIRTRSGVTLIYYEDIKEEISVPSGWHYSIRVENAD